MNKIPCSFPRSAYLTCRAVTRAAAAGGRYQKGGVSRRGGTGRGGSKGFALTWCRALTWYSSSARPLAAPDDPQLVTGQQGSPSSACQQLSRAQHVCAGGSSEGSTKLKHGTKLGRTLAT